VETSLRVGVPSCDASDPIHPRQRHVKMVWNPANVLSIHEGTVIAYWREF